MRALILIHRYLGMALGCVVTVWCLSGFVMMYVQYPQFTDAERVAGLETLDLAACCAAPGDAARLLGPDAAGEYERFRSVRLEMLAERPVLRLFGYGRQTVVDLSAGRRLNGLTAAEIDRVSGTFAQRLGLKPERLDTIERDQWTVSGSYDAHRPLYRYAGAGGTEWYLSSRSGEVVQLTTAAERFWNWLGAVPHWIYFTKFRQLGFVWSQTVIYLALVAVFLTVFGAYIGLKRLKRRHNGRLSPYRGFGLWHHYTGLLFGLLVLTWLVSGLFSMNPWGLLDGRSFDAELERLRARELTVDDARAVLQAAAAAELPPDTVRIDSSVVGGELSLLAWDSAARRRLLDIETLAPNFPSDASFAETVARMRPGIEIRSQGWLEAGDAYYFSHHGEAARLPVYRAVYEDGERFYLDAVSGDLVRAVDAGRQGYRWLFEALHRVDFAELLRTRPLWDLVMLPLLLGVTLSALTGAWMGIKRLLSCLR